ncbi:ATP-binding protein [Undibacterium sp.]|uniref:ATP-binding protein n=1 Tax=Undibacterium sp. TaxID=1914977 RepID=UPI0037511E2C
MDCCKTTKDISCLEITEKLWSYFELEKINRHKQQFSFPPYEALGAIKSSPYTAYFELLLIIVKISIGWRLFFAVLVSLIAIVAVALLLMREKVSSSFADYALKIELDRLLDVGEAIQDQYAQAGDWSFLPTEPEQKQQWINQELLRLYQIKNTADLQSQTKLVHTIKSINTSKTTVTAPSDPVAPASPVQGNQAFKSGIPPLPPPPLPPPPPIDLPSSLSEIIDLSASPAQAIAFQSLNSRISLIDEANNYLAGKTLEQRPFGRRPLYFRSKLIGHLQVQKSTLPSDAMARDFLQEQADTIAIIVLISVSLSGLAAMLLALHFRRPIHRLVDGARLLAEGHFTTRLDVKRSDELGELANSFNQLAEKLAQAERSRRQWVADTSHELRTPIAVLRAQLEALQDGIRPLNSENIALMLRQILSLNKLIDELYSLAKADIGTLHYQMQEMDIWTLIEEESGNFQDRVSKADLRLSLAAAPPRSHILGDSERLRQVIHNLLENSVRYTHRGGVIKISAECDQQFVLIHIEDSAPEVPQAALSRLGERFYRLDNSRSREHGGSGLGLALCSRILEAHQATIVFSASELGGLHVKLRFTLA